MRLLVVGNSCADQKVALKTRGLGSRTEMFCYSGAWTGPFGLKTPLCTVLRSVVI